MPMWEYNVEYMDHDEPTLSEGDFLLESEEEIEKWLWSNGALGWELVTLDRIPLEASDKYNCRLRAIFKRLKE